MKSLQISLAALSALSLAGTANAQTGYAPNPSHRTGNGGDAVIGCTTTANGTRAAWASVDGFIDGRFPAVVVVPLHLIRGGGWGGAIDFSTYNRVVGGDNSTFDRAASNGEVPYITGLSGSTPMRQNGYVQPLEQANEAYSVLDRFQVRPDRYGTARFVDMSAFDLCSDRTGRFWGRDSSGGTYTPRTRDPQ